MEDGWIYQTEAAKLLDVTPGAVAHYIKRGRYRGEVRREEGKVFLRLEDIRRLRKERSSCMGRPPNPDTPYTGRPPNPDTPYLERLPDGWYQWRREPPDDLKSVLGEAWTVGPFPPNTRAETLEAAAEAFTWQTDEIIEERRKRLGRDVA